MTDEQIKQAAIQRGCIEGTAEYYGFIEGARSRDWEVERLQRRTKQLRAELDKAKNTWVSVDERLPDDKQRVFICKSDGRMYCGKYNKSLKIFTTIDPSFTTWTINNVEAWMPIPKGGEL